MPTMLEEPIHQTDSAPAQRVCGRGAGVYDPSGSAPQRDTTQRVLELSSFPVTNHGLIRFVSLTRLEFLSLAAPEMV